MPTVKTSRTPEEVVAFLSRVYDDLSVADHFVNIMPGDIMRNKVKEAMQSLLEQAIEEMPRQIMKDEIPTQGSDLVDRFGFVARATGRNEAINEAIAAIKSLQERI